MNILMLGKPGSGKGTAARIMSKGLNLTHISSGDLFRDYIKEAGSIGVEIQSYIERGELVPDYLTIKFVEQRLSEPDCENGVILDGYPRTIGQAEALDKFFENRNQKIDIAIDLDMTDEDIIERTAKRVTCSNKNCGEIYNLEFKKPNHEGICDICGSRLEQREDDKPETIKARLETYKEKTGILIDYYDKKGILQTESLSIHSGKLAIDVAEEIVQKYSN